MNPSTPSAAQIEANRANARRSTGPRTESGKAHAAQNARVHGLCSRQLHIAGEEEAAIFASLREALSSQLAPIGELELTHFEALLHAQWNLRRCRMNEASLLASHPDPFLDPHTRAALQTVGIYTSRHERAGHRASKELKALQNERASRTNLADEPSPLVETARVRGALLAETRTKAALNKISFAAALDHLDSGSPAAPVSYFQFDLSPGAAHIAPRTCIHS